MEKLHRSMGVYVQSVSAKKEGEAREKMLPVDVLAQTMITHGEEFEQDSLFGNCLISMPSSPLLGATCIDLPADDLKKWDRRMRRLPGYRMHT